jgi:hypothetical protein
MPEKGFKRKEPSWEEVGVAMGSWGWKTLRADEKIVIFERGRQRIVARRIEGKKWKVEYYSGSIMDDISGITNTRFAKIEAMEMGIAK